MDKKTKNTEIFDAYCLDPVVQRAIVKIDSPLTVVLLRDALMYGMKNGWVAATDLYAKNPVLPTARAAEILRAAAEDAQLVMKGVNHGDTVSLNQHACISQVLVNLANAINQAERAGVKRAVVL